MTASGFVIRKNQYYDSVFLMGISKRIGDIPGVQQNAVLMAGEANKGVLSSIGIHDAQIDASKPNDLVVAVIAETPQVVDEALARLDEFMLGGVPVAVTSNPHSLEEGLSREPAANLAVISVPGEYAAREARKSLEAGLHVFLFSDNVSLADELDLKNLAAGKGLLVMGPDCGTSLIGGIGVGFANAVRRGLIGAIGVAGTGLQEFTSQVHNSGLGISHAIGTGGRDLSDEVGGLTTFAALAALEADPQTKVIAVISKPPGAKTLARLVKRFETCSKPVIGCFLGARPAAGEEEGAFHGAATIDEAVTLAIRLAGGNPASPTDTFAPEELDRMAREKASWSADQKYVRGLFAGGTFCYQSQQILRDAGLVVRSNAPVDLKDKINDSGGDPGHTLLDMGGPEFTLGKPHPMIDGTLRRGRILSESRDPQVAVLLLDFVLGHNASMDPVGELLDAIAAAKDAAAERGGALTVLASVCGTDRDPQDLDMQVKLLEQAGVVVFRSNARAASFCAGLLS